MKEKRFSLYSRHFRSDVFFWIALVPLTAGPLVHGLCSVSQIGSPFRSLTVPSLILSLNLISHRSAGSWEVQQMAKHTTNTLIYCEMFTNWGLSFKTTRASLTSLGKNSSRTFSGLSPMTCSCFSHERSPFVVWDTLLQNHWFSSGSTP